MIIRSIRNFCKLYDRAANIIADTEELIRNRSAIDFENDDCEVELSGDFPEEIYLRASLNPIAVREITKLIRTDSGKNFVIEKNENLEIITSKHDYQVSHCICNNNCC